RPRKEGPRSATRRGVFLRASCRICLPSVERDDGHEGCAGEEAVTTTDAGEDVLSRLRKLEKAVESGRYYGFQQDIWTVAADEIQRLRDQRTAAEAVLSAQGCECAPDVDMLHVGTDRCTACQISHALGFPQ